MTKFSSKDRNVNLELPVKIEFAGREYWIKATKNGGLFMNDQKPIEKNVLPTPDNIREPNKIQ